MPYIPEKKNETQRIYFSGQKVGWSKLHFKATYAAASGWADRSAWRKLSSVLEYVGMLNSIRLCVYCMGIYGGFLEWRYPKMDQNGWFLMENPKKKKNMDDLGVPPF